MLPSAGGQDQANIPAEISIAIKAGNATELAKYMNSTIELLLLDKEDFYKKNVAETILKDFFNEYQPKILQYAIRVQKMMPSMPLAILKQKREISGSIFCLRKLTRIC